MYIESIDTAGKNKCKIHLSNGVDLALYKGEVRQLHLQENDEITEDMYEKILEEILIPRARRRAMHLLEKMDRSTRQLESKLREGGYPDQQSRVPLPTWQVTIIWMMNALQDPTSAFIRPAAVACA